MSTPPWENWHHCMVHTYGTWLPGDDRGWHERNHHEHVNGDYKHPPKPTNFSHGRLNHSKDIMRHDPFLIPPLDRERFGSWLLDSFRHQVVPIACLAVTETNFHSLLQYDGDNCKIMLGRVKAHVMIQWGNREVDRGGERRPIWAGGSLPKPIHNKQHGVKVFQYILDHEKQAHGSGRIGWLASCDFFTTPVASGDVGTFRRERMFRKM